MQISFRPLPEFATSAIYIRLGVPASASLGLKTAKMTGSSMALARCSAHACTQHRQHLCSTLGVNLLLKQLFVHRMVQGHGSVLVEL